MYIVDRFGEINNLDFEGGLSNIFKSWINTEIKIRKQDIESLLLKWAAKTLNIQRTGKSW